MGKNIGPTIGLGGEAEFRKQIKNINAELGTLEAQLEKAAVSFEGNERSQQALSEKTEILTKMNDKLGDAVELTKKQHAEVSEKYGENSVAALKLEEDIYKLEKQYIKNNTAIQKNISELKVLSESLEDGSEALEDNSEALDKNSKSLDEHKKELNENADKVSFWSQEVQNQFNATSEMVDNCIETMISAISELNGMITESAQKAEEITTSSQRLGMSAQSYQELSYAASQLNISTDALFGSMQDLGEKAFDAMNDNGSEAAELFDMLNVSVTDYSGALKSSETIWNETLVALGNIANETERNAIASKLFGSSATELSSLMSSGGIMALQQYAYEANNIGYVLDSNTLSSLNNFNNSQRESQAIIDGVKDRISAQLAPSFAQASQAAAQMLLAFEPVITSALTWMLNHVPEIATGVMAFVGGLIALKIVSTLTPLINVMNSSLGVTNATLVMTNATLATNPLVWIVSGIVGAITGLVAGITLFNDKSEEITTGMNSMANSMESVGEATEKLEDGMEEVAQSIDWNSINLDFEAKFAILGTNSAAAFKRNLLEGLDGFENTLSDRLSGMQLNFSGNGTTYTPVIQSAGATMSTVDITLEIDKQQLAEILYEPLVGISNQKGRNK